MSDPINKKFDESAAEANRALRQAAQQQRLLLACRPDAEIRAGVKPCRSRAPHVLLKPGILKDCSVILRSSRADHRKADFFVLEERPVDLTVVFGNIDALFFQQLFERPAPHLAEIAGDYAVVVVGLAAGILKICRYGLRRGRCDCQDRTINF